MDITRKHKPSKWLQHTRNVFFAGMLAAVPLVVTYLVFRWLFDVLDGLFQPIIVLIIGRSLPGVGLVAVIILVYVLGLITTNFIGRRIVHWIDAMMSHMPVVQYVYSAARETVNAFRNLRQVPFKKVVMVEFPSAGMYSLGFVTGKASEFQGRKKIPVYVPTAPNPVGGYLVFLSAEDIFDTDLTVDEAMRMILSGGLLSPEAITRTPIGR